MGAQHLVTGPATPRLVGRHEELAALHQALDALSAAATRVVQVAGEAGMGKTRLLAELCTRADERGCLVLRGRATEFEQDLPFGMFVHALDNGLASLDLAELDLPRPELAAELACVFPSLARQHRQRQVPLQEERYRTYRAVRVVLEALSASRPLVFVLDDIHWADPASEELLSYLLRHPPGGSVLVAVAFRPSQVSPRLEASLLTTIREGRAERLELCPLTEDEATELLPPGIDRASREEIYRESAGNPFYLEELARAIGQSPRAERQGPGALEEGSIPMAVRSALAEELRQLSGPARALLEGASVAGDPCEVDTAASAGGMDIDDAGVLAALDELLEAGLVGPTDIPRRLRFRHPIVRRGIYQSLGEGWRIAAHARVAADLAAQGASAALCAHHLDRSAKTGDEGAIASLIDAASIAASGAPAIAARWYRAALRLLPSGREADHKKLGLQVPLAGALCSSGQLTEGRAVLLEALEQVPGRGELGVRLTASCAAIEHLLGRHSEARARLLRGLSRVPDVDGWEAAALKTELAVNGLYIPDYEQTCRWAGEAHVAARAVGDQLLRVTAASLVAYGVCALGRAQEAEPYLEEARSLLQDQEDAELATRLEASFYLGWAELFMERFDEAILHFRRGIAVSRATGQGYLVLPMMLGQELALSAGGRLREAQELAEACLDAAQLSGNAQYLTSALFEQCWVAARAGDVAKALASGEEALELAQTLEERILHASAAWALAGALLEAGQAQRCRDLLLTGLGGPELGRIPANSRCPAYEMLTRAELALGRPDAAAGWAQAARALAQRLGLPVATGAALRAGAEVLLASGKAEGAANLALAGAELERGAGAPIESARSLIVAGRALVEAGHRPGGMEQLERAEQELAACGAEGYRKGAIRELRRLGRRVAPRPAARSFGCLTPREREVAQLVADGRTNRKIADTLYLSVKTVERHLSNILTKLDVPSRVAVAAMVARDSRGLAPQEVKEESGRGGVAPAESILTLNTPMSSEDRGLMGEHKAS